MGSFLNCVVYRMENKKSFLRGRSFCPKCKHTLAWHDLIPIFSFLSLKGRCRYCKEKIAIQYLLVEMATGALLILNFKFLIFNQFFIFNFEFLIITAYLILINSLLVVIFIYDLKHYIIPDNIVFSAIAVAFLGDLFGFFNFRHLDFFKNFDFGFRIFENFKMPLIAAISAGGFFFLMWLISRGEWLGFGDVKLALFMGLFLGWPNVLTALFFAFISGSVIGLFLIVAQKKKMKSQVPFGPFLIAGTFFALFWGEKIINWYLGLIT